MLSQALQAIETLQTRIEHMEQDRAEPIAIVGLACRFPGASSAEAYWNLLHEGRDAVGKVPDGRWEETACRDSGSAMPYKPFGGFMDRIDEFDAAFFGIAGREAESMDPQQRLLLEVTWNALESANIPAGDLRGSMTGVFIGITTMDYARLAISGAAAGLDVYTATGGALNVAAGRLSYTLGLNGPAAAVDTACSSSLVALHLACQSLRAGDCEAALAGGVNVLLTPEPFVCFEEWGMMAPDGRCKTFDEKADGFVRSEGCGVVVLKRLRDAVAAGDRVLALIRGTAVNQDGASSGLTVPNGLAQQAVVRAALKAARLEAHAVDYVEAHGTGTTLGDPIELEALAEVLGRKRPAETPLRVGSVKTNIGHTESASGIAGLIKVVLALQHEQLPPHLHFRKLNPRISLFGAPIEVPTALTPWKRSERPRIAGVSSFGFSGTNAHAILEEAPPVQQPVEPALDERAAHLLVLSAKSETALQDLARLYAKRIAAGDDPLPDLCYSAAAGRTALPDRLALVAKDSAAAGEALTAFADGVRKPGVIADRAGTAPKIAFLFTGQGSQHFGMGRFLYDSEPVFRAAFDRCAELVRSSLDASLHNIIGYGMPDADTSTADMLDETRYTQPALFTMEYALAELWRSWGVEPAVVLGHSLGEYVAACVAGVLTLEDALKLVIARSRLMQDLPRGGAMIAVLAAEERVRAAMADYPDTIAIAAVNGPENTVISGKAGDVDAVAQQLQGEGIETRSLTVSHAFHSPLVEPMLDEFEQLARTITCHSARVPLVSNVTGAVIDPSAPMDAAYWRRHARGAVRFADSIRAVDALGVRTFLEIGPAPVLLGMARQCLDGPERSWLASMRKDQDGWPQILASLGSLFVSGATVDWQAYDRPFGRRSVDLPHYPFQRKRFWLPTPDRSVRRETAVAISSECEAHPLLGRRLRSPLRELQFEHVLDADRFPALREHRVAGVAIVPAAAFIELGAAAAKALYGTSAVQVERGWLRAALPLDPDSPLDVQLVVTPTDGDTATFEVFSRPRGAEAAVSWQSHAGGTLRTALEPTQEESEAPARDHCSEAVDMEAYQRQMTDVGLDYGPSFRALVNAWRGREEAFGELRLPSNEQSVCADLGVHPGILDAAFHLIGLALAESDAQKFYLPVGYELAEVHHSAGVDARAHVRLRAIEPSRVIADATLWRADGTLAARVRGLQVRPVTRAEFRSVIGADRQAHEEPLQIVWRRAVPTVQSGKAEGTWLVVGDDASLAAAVVDQFRARGHAADIGDASDTAALLDRVRAKAPGSVAGIIDLRPLSIPDFNADVAPTAVLRESAAIESLDLLRGIAATSLAGGLRLVLVTRHAQAVLGTEPVNPLAAVVWGIGATAATELTAVDVRLIDADDVSPAAPGLVDAALRGDGESRLALRADEVFVARLCAHSGSEEALTVPDGAYSLEMRERGTLDGLGIESADRHAPGPGEVELEVAASGLNFRDVLNLLDMYPGPAGPLGNECCGRVVAVGDGVEDVAVGDLVTCIADATFGSHVVAKASLVFPVPAQLSIAQAAVFPIAQLTAYLALHRVGRMKSGDRVLIHAGAGGVGLAAVHLALAAGADVLATAGSEEKRHYLRSLGVREVFDSRQPLAASVVRKATDGHGVDLLLNALTGEFIDEGLRAMAAGGRFLEIGLRELRDEEAVKAEYPDVEYHALLLGDLCRDEPGVVRAMYDDLVQLLAAGCIPAPRVRSYSMAEAGAAFRFMAKAQHIGRIAIVHPAAGRAGIRADSAYLVTGGLGALGLQVADWLADRGARHVVLMGRNDPSPAATERLAALGSRGVTVEVVRGDVAHADDLAFLSDSQRPPLRGVIHAAGVVDDAMLAEVDADRLLNVMRPKGEGAANLARATADADLDLFVFFSSGSAILGSAGQAAYAGANAFLDAMAHRMHAEGRNAVSVNWGAWEGGGMAADINERVMQGWAQRGIGVLKPDAAFAALEQAIAACVPQVAVLAIDWDRFFASLPAQQVPALLTELAPKVAAATAAETTDSSLRQELAALPPPQRQRLLLERMRNETAAVFGVEPDEVDLRAGLTEQGMDSLMAVELANRLGRLINVPLPSTFAFDYPTLGTLASHLLEQLFDAADDTPVTKAVDATSMQAEPDASELSDAELEDELRRELEQAGF